MIDLIDVKIVVENDRNLQKGRFLKYTSYHQLRASLVKNTIMVPNCEMLPLYLYALSKNHFESYDNKKIWLYILI